MHSIYTVTLVAIEYVAKPFQEVFDLILNMDICPLPQLPSPPPPLCNSGKDKPDMSVAITEYTTRYASL